MTRHCCDTMNYAATESKVGISYSPIFRQYLLRDRDPDSIAGQTISFCPWCGTRLPTSLRDVWFNEIEKLGIEIDITSIHNNPAVPPEYRSDVWWRSRESHA